MSQANEPPQESAASESDPSLIAEAEAEAAEAEALAAAARARARAARLRREAKALEAKAADAKAAEAAEAKAAEVQIAEGAPEAGEDEPVTDEAPARAEVCDETHADGEPESEPARSRWRRLRLPPWSATWKAAVILLICAFVGAIGYMVWQTHEATERERRAANFVAGARQGVVNMTSLDFKNAKADVQRVIDSSTGQFRDDFQQRAKDFTTVVEQSKVVTQGTVNAAAVQSMDANSAVVLVAATSKITNAAGAKDEPRNWRLRVTVTDEGGQYKMSKLEFIP
ncbi:hypothetical protein [Mycobacterium parmense]|uniref:Uncharacterized protein n=1 Tax=Mycobacterium parmense TaxID=185642 RepID=A0A7I7Z1L7_9MYCO|nr:hypothetical protein [Mycobacterium parmense]MCV7352509.1 hypothetical protein [Mycobacterium parmense]ORW55756.1 hypothetical protein AWC20_17460 [Mycobacterium parmense]BBZ47769.1 hypothetical protein MPRM_50500 [Mycobacterium parmense]